MDSNRQDAVDEGRKEWERTALRDSLKRFPQRKDRFTTLSGLPVKDLYTPSDRGGDDYLEHSGFPGQYPYTRGHPRLDVPGPPLDHPAGFGVRHRGGHEPAIQVSARPRRDRPFDRLRPSDASGPRLGRPHEPGRGRQDRRGHRYDPRRGAAVRRNPTGRGQQLPHHQRPGLRDHGDVRGCGGFPGCYGRQSDRHGPERHPQGVHGSERVHLPARARRETGRRRHGGIAPRRCRGSIR